MERVFRAGGTYEVIVAQNWESEGAYDVRHCYVDYRQ
jgi:hypothetical protein